MLSDLLNRHRNQLLRQCEEWFSVHQHRLLGYARQQADDTTDVELLLVDVMKEVTRIFCKGTLQESAMLPYSMRCIHNAAVTMRRKNIRRREAERKYSDEEFHLNPSLESGQDEADDTILKLRRAVQELPEELHVVVTLKIWDELSFAQISERLGIPKTTVQRRYLAAIAHMRKIITRN